MDVPLAWTPGDRQHAAEAAIASGRPEEALAVYAAADRANYGVLLWRLYRFDEAELQFQPLCDDPRTDAATLERIARCRFEAGRFAASARALEAAVRRESTPSAALLTSWAWTLERDHQTDAATAVLGRALNADADYGPAIRLLAHLERRRGEWSPAVDRLRRALDAGAGDFAWGLRYELAAILDRQGDYDAAWEELTLAKRQLARDAAPALARSHAARRRQAEVAAEVTNADLRRWRRDGADLGPPRRLSILTGFPRSGTTLLEQIIASHSDAVDTDESGILPAQFLEPLVRAAPDALSAAVELRSWDAEQLRAGREAYFAMTDAYLGEPVGQRLLIEKDPLLTADLPLVLRLFPEASLVVALRDPRDVVLSFLFTMVPLNWTSAPAIDVVESCRFYADVIRHWLLFRERIEQPSCVVRYEAIVEDAEREVGRAASFLGLTPESSLTDARRRVERRAVRTPTYDDVTKPIYARAVGRWRNYERQLAPGMPILAPFLRAFGYES